MTFAQTLLRWASNLACAILLISFGLFAIEQAKGGSQQQQNKVEGINQPSPSPQNERQREKEHGKVREAIDDADDVLVSPFSGVVNSGSIWAKRGVSTLLALLVYGLLARILIGYIPGRRN
ncbi:MAG: hypothetical protein QOD53_1273 [Thermoleophilaceae bacterium]|nr:hypothetical protein [Thermoleophilaceae bacterium]